MTTRLKRTYKRSLKLVMYKQKIKWIANHGYPECLKTEKTCNSHSEINSGLENVARGSELLPDDKNMQQNAQTSKREWTGSDDTVRVLLFKANTVLDISPDNDNEFSRAQVDNNTYECSMDDENTEELNVKRLKYSQEDGVSNTKENDILIHEVPTINNAAPDEPNEGCTIMSTYEVAEKNDILNTSDSYENNDLMEEEPDVSSMDNLSDHFDILNKSIQDYVEKTQFNENIRMVNIVSSAEDITLSRHESQLSNIKEASLLSNINETSLLNTQGIAPLDTENISMPYSNDLSTHNGPSTSIQDLHESILLEDSPTLVACVENKSNIQTDDSKVDNTATSLHESTSFVDPNIYKNTIVENVKAVLSTTLQASCEVEDKSREELLPVECKKDVDVKAIVVDLYDYISRNVKMDTIDGTIESLSELQSSISKCVSEYHIYISDLEDKCKKAECTAVKANSEIEMQKVRADMLEENCDYLHKQNERLKISNHNFMVTLNTISAINNNLKKSVDDVIAMKIEIESAWVEIFYQFDSKQLMIREYLLKILSSIKPLYDSLSGLNVLETKRHILGCIDEIEGQHKSEAEHLRARNNELIDEITRLKSENSAFRERNDELQTTNNEIKDEIHLQVSFVNDLERSMNEMIASNKFYEDQLIMSDNVIKELKESKQRASAEFSSELEKARRAFVKENGLLKLRIEELEAETMKKPDGNQKLPLDI